MVDRKMLLSPIFLIKVLELVLGTVCMALTPGQFGATTAGKVEVVHATYFGFFIVSAIVVISFLLDTPIHAKLAMVISACAAVMYITAAALNFEAYDQIPKGYGNDKILGSGVTGLINGLVYCGDIYLSFRQL